MMKVLSCTFYKSLGPFNILAVKGCSETVLFWEWYNQVIDSLSFPKESKYDDHLFFINVQNLMYFLEMEQKNQKKFLVFKIIALELGSTRSHILEQESSHWQSICYQTTLRFKISLSEVYSKTGSLRVVKNIMKVL